MPPQTLNYFSTLEEPWKGCLEFLRGFILDYSEHVSESWKNHSPFYYFNKKWLCYISYHPKTKDIYVGFMTGHRIDHPQLISEGRKLMKIFRVDPSKDIDVKSLEEILGEAVKIITSVRR